MTAGRGPTREEVEDEIRFFAKYDGMTVERVRSRSDAAGRVAAVEAYMAVHDQPDRAKAIIEVVRCIIEKQLKTSEDAILARYALNLGDKRLGVTRKERENAVRPLLDHQLETTQLRIRINLSLDAVAGILCDLAVDPCSGSMLPMASGPAELMAELSNQFKRTMQEMHRLTLLLDSAHSVAGFERSARAAMEMLPSLDAAFHPQISYGNRFEVAVGLIAYGQQSQLLSRRDNTTSVDRGLRFMQSRSDSWFASHAPPENREVAPGESMREGRRPRIPKPPRMTGVAEHLAAVLIRVELSGMWLALIENPDLPPFIRSALIDGDHRLTGVAAPS